MGKHTQGYVVADALVITKDQTGRNQHHYTGAIIPWLSDADAARLTASGAVVRIGQELEALVADVAPESEPEAEVGVATEKPKSVATKEAWVDYAASQGHDRAEAESLSKADLISLFG